MYDQHLPGYRTDFKNASWEIRESDHYRFHYFKDSLAEKEIERIVQTQEDAFRKIIDFLQVPSPEKKIDYYLYSNTATKEHLMGSPWFAQSIYDDFSVHALYMEEDRVIGPHEDTHLLSLPLGLSIGFFQEGLAERMVGHDWYGNSFRDTVREALSDARFVATPNLLTSHQAWTDTNNECARQYYSLAALFSNYVIDTYGKEKYIALYSSLKRDAASAENESHYLRILGVSSKELFEHFLLDESFAVTAQPTPV